MSENIRASEVVFAELRQKQRFSGIVGIRSREVKPSKNGDFLLWRFVDCHGKEMTAKRWRVSSSEIEATAGVAWAHAQGIVTLYNDTLEIEVTQAIISAAPPDNAVDYLPASPISISVLQARLKFYLDSVKQPHLHALLEAIFVEDVALAEQFLQMPAAKFNYHAFRHGLLQHTLEVTDTVEAIAASQFYWGPERVRFSRDLAITGALLHDLGKLFKYEQDGLGVRFSAGGGLLGHITQGIVLVSHKIAMLRQKGLDFPEELEQIVQHLISAHHGKREFGSPTLPSLAEAAAISYADLMSVEWFYFAEAQTIANQGHALVRHKKLGDRDVFVGNLDYIWGDSLGTTEDSENAATNNLNLGWSFVHQMRQSTRLPDVDRAIPVTPAQRKNSLSHHAALPSVLAVRTVNPDEETANGMPPLRISILGRVAAGLPLLHSANLDGEVFVENDGWSPRVDYYALRVKGDSMIGDGVFDGDLVIASSQNEVGSGQLVVALVDGDGATVKRLVRHHDSAELHSSNADYAPIVIENAEQLVI